MKSRLCLVFAGGTLVFSAAIGGVLFAGELSPPTTKPREPANWVFDILPKSLQKNPHLELTVITEVTPEGRKRTSVSPATPAYFVAQSSGYHRTVDAPAAETTLPPDRIDAFVKRSLAAGGHFPATPTSRPPTLVLIYGWGVHSRPLSDATLSGDQLARNFLDRARLVGGEKFMRELMDLLDQSSAQTLVSPAVSRLAVDGAPVATVLGADQLEFMNPINRFRDRSAQNEFLLEQVGNDVYYVTVSAYDHDALAKGQRVLLWRTRMTASADGVSQTDSLPTLIAAAAPYLGRDMIEPATLTRRAIQNGEVNIGVPVVVESTGRESEKKSQPK